MKKFVFAAAAVVCGLSIVLEGQTATRQTMPREVRLVLIDPEGGGRGGSDQMSMMALLQSPQVKVLGITVVTGDQWAPEEVEHTLRMLELIHRTDVPVVRGAVFPLVRTESEAVAARALYGNSPWYGAWTQKAGHHGPFVVPPLAEGEPTTKSLDEDAAHFLIRQVHAHPHQVTIYAAGPMTDIALALALDPQFAQLSAGLVMMGASLAPRTDDPEFATDPRHEFNFWFDPEAAHIVLRADWPRIDLTTTDISIKTRFTREMVKQIAESDSSAAQYVAKYSHEFGYLWDELAAVAWLDPKIITREQVMYVDVDLTRGPNYGNTLTWTKDDRPTDRQLQPVHVQEDLNTQRFYKDFVKLMQGAPR
jgi:inosine-uridine nucleoside N-ribohydrolase